MSKLYYNNDSLSISSGYLGSIKLSKVYKGESLIWVFTKPVVLPYTYFDLELPFEQNTYFYFDSYAGPGLTEDDLQDATELNLLDGELCYRKSKESGYAIMSNANEFYLDSITGMWLLSPNINISAFEYHYRVKEGGIWVEKSRYLTRAESEKIFSKMTYMNSFFSGQTNIKGSPICGPLVTDFNSAYRYCSGLTGDAACGDSVLGMTYAYYQCTGLNGSAACGPNVTNMSYSYYGCTNLLYAVCGEKVENMNYAYYNCTSLLTAACSDSVQNMSNAYRGCTSLTTAVCGNNVTNMSYAYQNCTSLTTAVCGNNVIYMGNAYSGCTSLTTAVCGDNVQDMNYAYSDCTSLTTAVFGPKVGNAPYAYYNTRVEGDVYLPENSDFALSGLFHCFDALNPILAERNEIRVHAKVGSAAATALDWAYTFVDDYNAKYKIRRILYT